MVPWVACAGWICLIVAIAFEVTGTVLMKLSKSILSVTSLLMLIAFALSLFFCMFAARRIPISIVYASWSAIGIAAVAIIGTVYFKEPMTLIKIVSLILIVIGVLGLLLNEHTH